MGEPLCVVFLTEPKHPPRHGPASAPYEHGRGNILAEALMAAGHRCVMWWDHPIGPLVVDQPDVVLLRSSRPLQLDRARHLASEGIPVLNDPDAHAASTDKRYQQLAFARDDVPRPRTERDLVVARSALSTEVVVKPRRGSSGLDVRLASLGEALMAPSDDELIQERLLGEEYRVTVVGNDAVAWARKTLEPGEFRGNLRQGAQMYDARCPSPEAESCALSAVGALRLAVAGVDLMMTERGPVIIEVNAATTLYGASSRSTASVLRAVIELVERSVGTRLA